MADAPAGRAAGVVLAAGGSRRMGRPKQLLDLDGRPLLARVVEQACASTLDEVVVVLGAHAEEVLGAVDLGRARAVVNPRHEEGMSTSLQAGLRALGGDVERAVVLLADQPGVSTALVDTILALHASAGRPAAAARAAGVLQPPAVLPRAWWGVADTLDGDVGLRTVLRERAADVAALDVAALDDVDTPEDWALLLAQARGTSAPG